MTSSPFKPLGWHYLLDLYDCSSERINDLDFVLSSLQQAVQRSNSTLVELVSHQFTPQGLTAVALLKESHLSIHCWPESLFVAVDLFTCGQHGTPNAACDFLAEQFESQSQNLQVIRRGRPDVD